MCGPSEDRWNVDAQESDVVGVFHPPRSPEVHKDFLGPCRLQTLPPYLWGKWQSNHELRR